MRCAHLHLARHVAQCISSDCKNYRLSGRIIGSPQTRRACVVMVLGCSTVYLNPISRDSAEWWMTTASCLSVGLNPNEEAHARVICCGYKNIFTDKLKSDMEKFRKTKRSCWYSCERPRGCVWWGREQKCSCRGNIILSVCFGEGSTICETKKSGLVVVLPLPKLLPVLC